HLVPHGHAHVPERVEQRVRERRRLAHVPRAEPHVEVALEGDRPPPVTAHARQGHRAPRRGGDTARRLGGEGAALQPAEEGGEEVVEDAGMPATEGHAGHFERDGALLSGDGAQELGAAAEEGGSEILEEAARGGGGGRGAQGSSVTLRSGGPTSKPSRR